MDASSLDTPSTSASSSSSSSAASARATSSPGGEHLEQLALQASEAFLSGLVLGDRTSRQHVPHPTYLPPITHLPSVKRHCHHSLTTTQIALHTCHSLSTTLYLVHLLTHSLTHSLTLHYTLPLSGTSSNCIGRILSPSQGMLATQTALRPCLDVPWGSASSTAPTSQPQPHPFSHNHHFITITPSQMHPLILSYEHITQPIIDHLLSSSHINTPSFAPPPLLSSSHLLSRLPTHSYLCLYW